MQYRFATRNSQPLPVGYRAAILIGILTAVISIGVPRLDEAWRGGMILLSRRDIDLMLWVVVEHITVAVSIATTINLIRPLASRFTRNSAILGPGVVALIICAGLAFGCASFVEELFAFYRPAAWGYSVLFAAALTMWGLRLVAPILYPAKPTTVNRWLVGSIAFALVVLASYLPLTIGIDDWNSILHVTLTLLLWFVLAISISRLSPLSKRYSIGMVVIVQLGTLCCYSALKRSQTVWASDLGRDRTQITREMQIYAGQNTSFRLVDTLMGNEASEPCDADCRTLRQYSNLINARIARKVLLVDNLVPIPGLKPNIFIFVIDSLRPDYLGAYNSRVDFTPDFDAFARDSVVMRRAYADYAGTSLSEPSIWSGALLPHSHYATPFQNANSLERLARCDGYQIVISYDGILRQLIEPSKDMVLLDADKEWPKVEISATIEQLEKFLDHPASGAPVFFYAQPMNVQGHASNNLPKRNSQNWQSRPGFDDRIAYAVHQTDQFFGNFIRYLKSKGLYENSIIIITADHGDATGEFGRVSHSLIIYPEVMRVPLIVHLPRPMASKYVYDEGRLSALIDIAPSLYYLLGHRPIQANPLFGKPIFVETKAELSTPRSDLFLASDAIAAYGILSGDSRWFYTTYDMPSRSMLFDLTKDSNALQNVVTPETKKNYDERILEYLKTLSEFYGNQPRGSTDSLEWTRSPH